MKKSFLLCLLFVGGCIPHWADYEPKLATKPKDRAKYETDRKFCLDAVHERRNLDPLAHSEAWSTKAPRELVDECMAAKGYDVIKVDRPFGVGYGNNEKVFP